jgi:hypothetical protein
MSQSTVSTQETSQLRKQLPIWFLIISLWGVWTAIILLSVFYTSWSLYDYSNYYHAAQRFNQGLPINLSIEAEVTYIYPPLLAQVLAPLEATLPFMETAVIWTTFNIACLLLSTFLLASQMQSNKKRYIVWLMPILFIPTFETYLFGQVVPIILLLSVVGMIAYQHKQYMVVGICLAVATWFKIYPLLLIVYFIVRQEWRVVWWAFVAGMVLLLFQIALSGTDVMVNYFTTTLIELASKGQDFNLFNNHSLLGVLRKVFGDSTLVSISRLAITGGMVGIMIRVSNRNGYKKLNELPLTQFEIEYSLVIVFMMLMGSTLHASGMLPLLLSLIIAIKHTHSSTIYSLLFTVYLVLGLTFFLIYKDLFLNSPPILQGIGLYALLILWGVLVHLRGKTNDWIPA